MISYHCDSPFADLRKRMSPNCEERSERLHSTNQIKYPMLLGMHEMRMDLFAFFCGFYHWELHYAASST